MDNNSIVKDEIINKIIELKSKLDAKKIKCYQ